jgi:hypothetical protein
MANTGQLDDQQKVSLYLHRFRLRYRRCEVVVEVECPRFLTRLTNFQKEARPCHQLPILRLICYPLLAVYMRHQLFPDVPVKGFSTSLSSARWKAMTTRIAECFLIGRRLGRYTTSRVVVALL